MKRIIALFAVSLALTGIVNAQSIVSSDRTVDKSIPSFRIAVQGGFAYQLGKVDNSQGSEMTEFQKDLKKGSCYSADVTYFFSEALGLGVRYSNSHYSANFVSSLSFQDGSTRKGTFHEEMNLNFVGPFLSYRWLSPDARNAFYINYGLGYLGMVDDAVIFEKFKIKGGTLGHLGDIGYDFSITKHFALGATISLVTGTCTSYTLYNSAGASETIKLDKDKYETYSHLSFSIGFRFLL